MDAFVITENRTIKSAIVQLEGRTTKNVTLKLDEEILKLCRYEAVEAGTSLSRWISVACPWAGKRRMAPERVFFDTNILFYALYRSAGGKNVVAAARVRKAWSDELIPLSVSRCSRNSSSI